MNILTNYQILQTNKYSKINNSKNQNLNFKRLDLQHRGDIEKLTPAENLFFLAHPDDESCFFYFISNLLAKDSGSVQLIYTNSGQNGRDARGILERYDPRMKDLREHELIQAIDEGYNSKRSPLVLDFIDGQTHLEENKRDMKVFVKEIIDRVKPANIFTFEPKGITNHSDHRAISEVTSAVFEENKDSLTKDKKLWKVGLTKKAAELLIKETERDTHIFTYVRPSIERAGNSVDVSRFIEQIYKAMSAYKSQFKPEAVESFCAYLKKYPLIDMIMRR